MRPSGAFYAFPGFSGLRLSAEKIALGLLREAHVAVVPGTVFGLGGDGHVRLSFCCSTEDVREGAARVAGYLQRL